MRRAVGILAGLALLTGCASAPSTTREIEAVAKEFAPPPADASRLIVYRPVAMRLGGAVLLAVTIDDRNPVDLGPGMFLSVDLDPGSHTLYTRYGTAGAKVIGVETTAGAISYYQISLANEAKPVNATKAQAAIRNYRLAWTADMGTEGLRVPSAEPRRRGLNGRMR